MKYPQWFFDQTSLDHATGMGIPKPRKLASPSFFSSSTSAAAQKKLKTESDASKASRAWDFAQGPFKQLPATIAMAWFSGNSLQIVTISMVIYGLLLSPLVQILKSNAVFAEFKTQKNAKSVLRAQIMYICASLLAIGAGIWKFDRMGLLPTHPSEWLQWETPTVWQPRLTI